MRISVWQNKYFDHFEKWECQNDQNVYKHDKSSYDDPHQIAGLFSKCEPSIIFFFFLAIYGFWILLIKHMHSLSIYGRGFFSFFSKFFHS